MPSNFKLLNREDENTHFIPQVVHVSTGVVDIRSAEKIQEQKQEVTTVLNEDHSPVSSTHKFAA